jgi:hypothetical protein
MTVTPEPKVLMSRILQSSKIYKFFDLHIISLRFRYKIRGTRRISWPRKEKLLQEKPALKQKTNARNVNAQGRCQKHHAEHPATARNAKAKKQKNEVV